MCDFEALKDFFFVIDPSFVVVSFENKGDKVQLTVLVHDLIFDVDEEL